MDLSRALSVLQGAAVPAAQPGEYEEAVQMVLEGEDGLEAALCRMGHDPEYVRHGMEQLRRALAR